MMRLGCGPKNVSSSKRKGIAAVTPGFGYCQKMCFELLTSSIRLLPRSAISRYPGIGPGGWSCAAAGVARLAPGVRGEACEAPRLDQRDAPAADAASASTTAIA